MSTSASIRFRGNKNVVEIAKQLDAFKKIPHEYTETTKIGGILSLASRALIIYLIYQEISNYLDANLIYSFKPDLDMDDRVKLHVDVTVATPCEGLSGVDLVDETQQDIFTYGPLKRENTFWEMSPEERFNFDNMQALNSFLREEFHSIADILFKDIVLKDVEPPIDVTANKVQVKNEKYDACRLYGSLSLNKVAGVLNFVSGGSAILQFGNIHIHLDDEFNANRGPRNFSHRINKLSFGGFSRKIVQPLEGDERYVDDSTVVQYFIKVVPTEIHNIFSTIQTYQYSVTENFRKIGSDKNSYGTEGIYFKYDWSALKVIVRSDRENFIQFFIHLCSIISGIVVISGILNSVIRGLLNVVKQISSTPQENKNTEKTPLLVNEPIVVDSNDLIRNANKMANQEFLVNPTISQ